MITAAHALLSAPFIQILIVIFAMAVGLVAVVDRMR